MLTKDHAKAIAAKLGATEKPGKKNSPHDIQLIYLGGKLIAHFGIRRGSRRDAGHDHIPKSLHVSPHFCLELATCTKYLDDWLAEMKKRQGIIF
jgi:hypothetical protein